MQVKEPEQKQETQTNGVKIVSSFVPPVRGERFGAETRSSFPPACRLFTRTSPDSRVALGRVVMQLLPELCTGYLVETFDDIVWFFW